MPSNVDGSVAAFLQEGVIMGIISGAGITLFGREEGTDLRYLQGLERGRYEYDSWRRAKNMHLHLLSRDEQKKFLKEVWKVKTYDFPWGTQTLELWRDLGY